MSQQFFFSFPRRVIFFLVFLKVSKEVARRNNQLCLSGMNIFFSSSSLCCAKKNSTRVPHRVVVSREKKENKGAETTQQPVSLDSNFHFYFVL